VGSRTDVTNSFHLSCFLITRLSYPQAEQDSGPHTHLSVTYAEQRVLRQFVPALVRVVDDCQLHNRETVQPTMC